MKNNCLIRIVFSVLAAVILGGCSSKHGGANDASVQAVGNEDASVTVRYATGFSVRDSADVRLVCVGEKDRFALVRNDEAVVPDGYIKVCVPIRNTICMTALQLSNFTVLDAHDVVKGITGTKNLFNKDILQRVKDGRIVKIGMEGEFDTEMVLAANPVIVFGCITGMSIARMFIGGIIPGVIIGLLLMSYCYIYAKKHDIDYGGIHYNPFAQEKDSLGVTILKEKVGNVTNRPTVTSGEMHYGNWHAVGGKNYLAQIFRDAGADYVIDDEETSGENLEFEKMYSLSANADYWRILNSFDGEFSYEALKASEPRNELLKAFREKKVIYCNMKQTPYYEISPVKPDVLLKDFVAIFHPEFVEEDYRPTFYYLLK